MNPLSFINSIVVIFLLTVVIGCGQPQAKSTNSSEAITQAQTLQTNEEKIKYLISEANAFVNSQKFDEAINTAKYVLTSLDANSQEAKTVIEKATEELKKMAEAKAEELKKSLPNLGK